MRKRTEDSPKRAFLTKKAFRQALDNYFDECASQGRIPNVAGFCSYSRITRSGYFGLRAVYPHDFDVAESAFIDASVNSKVPSSGSSLEYLLTTIDNIALEGGEEVISSHAASDGD